MWIHCFLCLCYAIGQTRIRNRMCTCLLVVMCSSVVAGPRCFASFLMAFVAAWFTFSIICHWIASRLTLDFCFGNKTPSHLGSFRESLILNEMIWMALKVYKHLLKNPDPKQRGSILSRIIAVRSEHPSLGKGFIWLFIRCYFSHCRCREFWSSCCACPYLSNYTDSILM